MAFRLAATLLLLAHSVLAQSGIYQQCGGIGWCVFTVGPLSLSHARHAGLDQRLVFPAQSVQDLTIVRTGASWNLRMAPHMDLSQTIPNVFPELQHRLRPRQSRLRLPRRLLQLFPPPRLLRLVWRISLPSGLLHTQR